MPTPCDDDTHAADSWPATQGAGQSDRKSLPSVRCVFVHLSDVGTVEVVVHSTLVGILTCFRIC